MNILTVYAYSPSELITVLDEVVSKTDAKVLAADPTRLYNDENHSDVSLSSITFSTTIDHDELSKIVSSYTVFVRIENPNDWA